MFFSLSLSLYIIVSYVFLNDSTFEILLLVFFLLAAYVLSYKELVEFTNAGRYGKQFFDFDKYDYFVVILLFLFFFLTKKYVNF